MSSTLLIDVDKISNTISGNEPYEIKTFVLNHAVEDHIVEVLEQILKNLGKEYIKDKLAYCIREIAMNAGKANNKRVYFLENGFDITNEQDYQKGMEGFKDSVNNNLDYYFQRQQEMKLYVRVIFKINDDRLVIEIRNNSPITIKEQIRLFDKIARARAFNSMEDAFNSALDTTEGAGLGMIIMVLMLRNLGLEEDVFELTANETETIASLKIPLSLITKDQSDFISETIIKELDSIPQFPENILRIQHLISDPNSNLEDIASEIRKDPSLTADLLKLANSAVFMIPKRVYSIHEAVKMIGLRGVRNLLFTYGTQDIMTDKYRHDLMEEMWHHSYKVAYFSYQIARSKKIKEQLEDVYIGGILHDIGKIIVTGLHPGILSKIRVICKDKNIPQRIIEDLAVGNNHAKVGSMLAEKWNFPDKLVKVIEFHHQPLRCDVGYVAIVYPVYLANSICNYLDEQIQFAQIEKRILEFFGIVSETQFKVWCNRLENAYIRQLGRFQATA